MGVPLADVKITAIDSAELVAMRPRVVGCNARLPTHGQKVLDPIAVLHTDAGVSGWGWSCASEQEAARLLGRRLADVFDPQTGTVDEFLSFDFPLWDLAGRLLGQSVHTMLGDHGCDPVPIYDGSIYIEEIDPDTRADAGIGPVLDAVRMGLQAGFRAFKVKVGRGYMWMDKAEGLARDIEVLHEIRRLIGPDATLLIDANNGCTPAEARELMQGAGDCDIGWFEEPFPEDAHESVALKRYMRECGWDTLLADGEGLGPDKSAFTEVLRAGGVDVVQFDMRAYTLSLWLRYLPILEETGALHAPHNWASHLAGFYIVQFARGCGRFAMGETDPCSTPVVHSSGYVLSDGKLTVPDAPGFGLELDAAGFAAARTTRGA